MGFVFKNDSFRSTAGAGSNIRGVYFAAGAKPIAILQRILRWNFFQCFDASCQFFNSPVRQRRSYAVCNRAEEKTHPKTAPLVVSFFLSNIRKIRTDKNTHDERDNECDDRYDQLRCFIQRHVFSTFLLGKIILKSIIGNFTLLSIGQSAIIRVR